MARLAHLHRPRMNAEELAAKHHVSGRALRAMLRAHLELTPGHNPHEHYEIDAATEARIVAHPEFAKLLEAVVATASSQ